MNPLKILCVAICFGELLFGLSIKTFNDSPLELAGTDTRLEYEFKFAFSAGYDFDIPKFSKKLKSLLRETLRQKRYVLQFSKSNLKSYKIEPKFGTFMFKDIYLDTPQYDLLNAGSGYRLRHRWNRYALYRRFQWLPFISAFHPIRCEIQFKTAYRANPSGMVTAEETRFEFRNESEPFARDQSAPPPPWPEKEYLSFAETGIFQKYRMKPMAAMIESFKSSQKGKDQWTLTPTLKTLSLRNRLHLTLPNAWGVAPNPDQVFIVTIDRVEAIPQRSSLVRRRKGRAVPSYLIEVEVEIDRSVLGNVFKVLNKKPSNPEEAQKIILAREAYHHLYQDLITITKRLKLHLEENFELLPINYKYARLMKMWGVQSKYSVLKGGSVGGV